MQIKYYKGIDVLKMLAAIGVVAAHTGAKGLDMLSCLCVPVFAIISSTFFFRKYDMMTDGKIRYHYLLHFLKRIFFLYLFWQILYLPLAFKAYIELGDEFKNVPERIGIFLYRFIFPGHDCLQNGTFIAGTNGWGASWYLIALLMGMPIFCLLLRYTSLIFTTFVSIILEVLYILSDGYRFATHLYIWGVMCFPRLFIYFLIGKMIAQKINQGIEYKTSHLLWISILSIVLFISECLIIWKLGGPVNGGEKILSAPTSALLVITAFNMNNIHFNTRRIRGFSTFLYTSQAYFILTVAHIVSNGWLQLVLTTAISYIFYLLYLIVRKKTNWKVLSYAI